MIEYLYFILGVTLCTASLPSQCGSGRAARRILEDDGGFTY
jgi:hypothetical protein